MKETKVKTSFTLPRKVKALIVILSEKLGVSQTAVVVMAVWGLAKSELEDKDLQG